MNIPDKFSLNAKLKRIRRFFRRMVVSRKSASVVHPCIKESGISSRPITQRVAELPSLRYGAVGAKTATTGPLRVSSHYTTASRKKGDEPTRPARRVRFNLPSTDGGGIAVAAKASAGDGWLRTRAPFSNKRSDGRRTSETVLQQRPPPLVRRDLLPASVPVPVTASPGVRNRIHPTGRYVRGTLSPTANASPHAAAAPGGLALLRAARDGDDLLLRDLLRRAVLVGIAEADLNVADCTGRTALSYIASNGTIDLLEQILQLPSLDANKADNEGNTPLHFAAQAGQVDCLNCILTRCQDIEIDARNNLGFTALMKAALQGRNKCAKLLLLAGANPTLRDNGRGFRADQWARFCGRYVCADVIEKYARQRLLERSTSYGNWGGENEFGARVLMGKVVHVPPVRQQHSHGFKSKLRNVFRTSSGNGRTDDSFSTGRLVSQLTSAALCASSPVLPSGPTVPSVVKSLIRPLTVPKLQITLVNNNDDYPNNNVRSAVSEVEVVKPARTKKKK